jgi:hypothetical protein
VFQRFSKKSQDRIVTIKFLELLQKRTKPVYIEVSQEKLGSGVSKSEYIANMSKGKRHVIVIDLDEIAEANIEAYKRAAYITLVEKELKAFERLVSNRTNEQERDTFFTRLKNINSDQEELEIIDKYARILEEKFTRKLSLKELKTIL